MDIIQTKLESARKYYVLSQPRFPRFKKNLIMLYKCAEIYEEIGSYFVHSNISIYKYYIWTAMNIYKHICKCNINKNFKQEILKKISNTYLHLKYL